MSAAEPPRDVERLRAALERLGEDGDWPEVDAERIYAALHGDMSATERRDVVDELIRNPRAAAAWRLARELAPDKEATAHGPRTWRWMSVAAAVVLMVGVAWLFRPSPPQAPVYRGAEPRSVASLLAADAPLPRAQPILRWTALEGARYRLRVLSPDLDLLEEADNLEQAEYRLAPGVVAAVPPGGRLLWQVEARVPGTSTVVSPTFNVLVP